jgi:hypothetical protein
MPLMDTATVQPAARRVLPPLVFFLVVSGCSSGERFLPVAGTVNVNGQPLTLGTVSFRPDATRGNASLHHPTGEIDAHGHYELSTVGKKGAPPGWYKVLVFADLNQQKGPIHPEMPRWAVNVKYTRVETSDLYVEVVEKPGSTDYDLNLSPP